MRPSIAGLLSAVLILAPLQSFANNDYFYQCRVEHVYNLTQNGQNAGVSVLTLASIAGWADPQRRVSKHLLNYGSTGVSQSAIVIKLRDDSMIMHKELIALEQSLKAQSNVLAFG